MCPAFDVVDTVAPVLSVYRQEFVYFIFSIARPVPELRKTIPASVKVPILASGSTSRSEFVFASFWALGSPRRSMFLGQVAVRQVIENFTPCCKKMKICADCNGFKFRISRSHVRFCGLKGANSESAASESWEDANSSLTTWTEMVELQIVPLRVFLAGGATNSKLSSIRSSSF